MQVVIEISERIYKKLAAKQEDYPWDYIEKIETAITYGTPLPKGHGRLKDVDYGLKNCKDEHEIEYWGKEVPTIIEADKESGSWNIKNL